MDILTRSAEDKERKRRRCKKYIRMSQSATTKAAFCDSGPGSCRMSGGQLKLTSRWEQQGSGAYIPAARSTYVPCPTILARDVQGQYVLDEGAYVQSASSKWGPIKSATPTPIGNYYTVICTDYRVHM